MMRQTAVEVSWRGRPRLFVVDVADHGVGVLVIHRIALSREGRRRPLDWNGLPILLVIAITQAVKQLVRDVQHPWYDAPPASKL